MVSLELLHACVNIAHTSLCGLGRRLEQQLLLWVMVVFQRELIPDNRNRPLRVDFCTSPYIYIRKTPNSVSGRQRSLKL
jgi:hypothetical protein